jgi:hypothetical protein
MTAETAQTSLLLCLVTSALHGSRSAPRSGRFTAGKRPGTYPTGDWVSPGPILMGVENLAPIGIRTTDRPTRSE